MQDSAFRTGDAFALRAARRELEAGIKRSKASYALKIQGHFPAMTPGAYGRVSIILVISAVKMFDALNTYYG